MINLAPKSNSPNVSNENNSLMDLFSTSSLSEKVLFIYEIDNGGGGGGGVGTKNNDHGKKNIFVVFDCIFSVINTNINTNITFIFNNKYNNIKQNNIFFAGKKTSMSSSEGKKL